MHHRNSDTGSDHSNIIRRTATCATLATLTTIGVFSLVATLMSHAVERARTAVADDVRTMELTVVTARREPATGARAEAANRGFWNGPKAEAI